jgi:hypothetical protein
MLRLLRNMSDAVVESLIVDLLEWISRRPERTYEETMDAWRTSCPRLPVWEDANDRGLVATEYAEGRNFVRLTTTGREYLAARKSGRLNACPTLHEPGGNLLEIDAALGGVAGDPGGKVGHPTG